MRQFLFLIFSFLLVPGFAKAQNTIVAEALPRTINSQYDELTPVILADGKALFFTRAGSPDFDHTLMYDGQNLFETMNYNEYLSTLRQAYHDISGSWVGGVHQSPANQDIWFASFETQKVEHLSHPLNNALPNSVLCRTPDPDVFYVLNRHDQFGGVEKGVSMIKRLGDSWSYPAPVQIEDFYTSGAEISLTISFDGEYMLLSMRRNDAQDLDLYLCKRLGYHHWSAPQLLGDSVNSPFRETAPSLSDDGQVLYFSSNRDGDHDVYFSKRLDDTWLHWSQPQKMGAPINSAYDDGQPSFNSATGNIYFTSKRSGDSDIYRAHIAPPQVLFVTVQGRVLNDRTGALVKKATVHYTTSGGDKYSVFVEDGTFKLQIPRGKKYEIYAEKAGYSDARTQVEFKRESRIFDGIYVLDLALSPFEVDEKIVLNPFYFRQSKAELLEASFGEVDRLATILKENPTMEIRIEGHTDNLGRVIDLEKLSHDRAEAIKQHLIDRGIEASRLTTVGYGGTRPFTSNETEEERKKNRRVEIIITKI